MLMRVFSMKGDTNASAHATIVGSAFWTTSHDAVAVAATGTLSVGVGVSSVAVGRSAVAVSNRHASAWTVAGLAELD